MKLVLVEWLDSDDHQGWNSRAEVQRLADKDPLLCMSVGWVVADTDRYLLLAPSRGAQEEDEMQVCDVMQIPRAAVSRVRPLTPGRTLRQ